MSLVGATKLPSSAELRKETLIIARMGGKGADDLLNIEIRPTNEVIAAHYRSPDKSKPIAQEKLNVSADEAERLRGLLWRLRPDAAQTTPVGCDWVYDAGFDWAVVYVREDRPANMLTFTLPYPEYCKTRDYAEARELIEAVVKALPRSNVIQRFPPGKYHPLGTYSP
jgi:hypothetical protein